MADAPQHAPVIEDGLTISRGPLSEEEILAHDAVIAASQKELAHLRKPGVLASDELVAERRLEAWREEVEALAWRRQRAS